MTNVIRNYTIERTDLRVRSVKLEGTEREFTIERNRLLGFCEALLGLGMMDDKDVASTMEYFDHQTLGYVKER